ncbi:ABC transporter ATP-binding protein [Litoreibacter janthinus]|uniref:Capsular polysaccharide transport system ATP-binding protein n=1 Tax=Litoreibacter janthinus TaxID=670154 RepID=A0A1I6ICU0_9RHOB|nr:ABC transporter ATP-binding protein [Litoreibacter janthinus]SFR64521.1 capsular polysaccharide transport system ATP-binding protein [Litoreibacter janthinus]
MVKLEDVSKSFRQKGQTIPIVLNASCTFPGRDAVGLLGRNGAGKSTLLRMIAGLEQPDTGTIRIEGRVSWPVGFQGSFHPDLSGLENTRFVARLYRIDTNWMTHFVREFSELGAQFNLPFRSYSSGMRARLAFAVSMAVPFDTYLIDEITAVGDAAFRNKCERTLTDRLDTSGAIIVTHSMEFLRRTCRSGVVLDGGAFLYFKKIEDAIAHHLERMKTVERGRYCV